jgi:hypothetical protein
LKSTSKSGSLPTTLLFCQVILFSFAAAYGLTWLLKEPALPEARPVVNRPQLFQNYRILNLFLVNGSRPGPAQPESADLNNPLLAAIESLKQAQQLFEEKKYSACAVILNGMPRRFPHVAARRDDLLLKCQYAARQWREFISTFDAHPAGSLETRILRLNCLLRTGRQQLAASEFKALFARQRLQPFFQKMSRLEAAALLQRLDENDWFAKFTFLLKNGEGSEFRRELPYSPFKDLNRLFRAEFAYLGRGYGQAKQLLRAPIAEKYRAFAEKIRVKIDVRENPGLDVEARLQSISRNSRLYPELLFDLGQILVGKKEFAKALPYYTRYLRMSRERNDDYWKTVWLMAWIHYRQNDREQALEYFRQGSESPVLSYRIASRFWQSKLENGKQPEMSRYPFSYYAVRVLGNRERFKNLHQGFLSGIDEPPGPRFLEIVEDLKVLAKYKLWDEAMETIHWAKSDPRLGACDLNLLKIIESLLYYQQNHFYLAFAKFRSNFRYYESVRLPNFLSGIFFPRQYESLISAYSKEQEVDPGLVLALIREESFFRSDAKSPAKAYGLMQLLHGTAREIAGDSDLKVKAMDLIDPEINIRLGLSYLKSLLDKYDGRLYLALAAYNAGPHRVDQWLLDFPAADEDEFIEMIPFTETRTYVKNILRNYFFYRYYSANGKA